MPAKKPLKIATKDNAQRKHQQTLAYLLMGLSLVFIAVLLATPSIAKAETLAIPEPPKSFSVTLPGRGMSMTEVLDKFGEPQTKDPEVGEPPITRWNYESYRVIFEYQYVIHSLSTNKPMGLKQPEPEEEQSESKMVDHDEHGKH